MIISQLRYKVTDKYSIDSGILGPTEVRIIFSFALLLGVLLPWEHAVVRSRDLDYPPLLLHLRLP